MVADFEYLTPADYKWSIRNYPLLVSPLTSLALQQLSRSFEKGLSYFPEFHDTSEEANYEVEECWETEEGHSFYALVFLECARNLLDSVHGQLGKLIRSKILADLNSGTASNVQHNQIKPSVLISLFGREDFTTFSIKLEKPYHFFQDTVLSTLVTKCPNLTELTLDVSCTFHGYEDDGQFADVWKPLEKLTSLESLTLVGSLLPSDWNVNLKLKTLKLVVATGDPHNPFRAKSSYNICTAFLRPEFKHLGKVIDPHRNSNDYSDSLAEFDSAPYDFLDCAKNQASLQPLCQTLRTLRIEQWNTSAFWQPITAAFLLMACPNLKHFYTTNYFPYSEAIAVAGYTKKTPRMSFNLAQMHTVLEDNEGVRSVIRSTPHCEELVIQGSSADDAYLWESVELCGRSLKRLMNQIGDMAEALSVRMTISNEIHLEDLGVLSKVRRLHFAEWAMDIGFAKSSRPPRKKAILENLQVLVLNGCLERSSSKELDLLLECPNLEELYFECIHFCSTGRQLVEFAGLHFKKLKLLYFKFLIHVAWDSDDIIALLEACPGLDTLVLPHEVLHRGDQVRAFAELHAFANQRGVELRYDAPRNPSTNGRDMYCIVDENDCSCYARK